MGFCKILLILQACKLLQNAFDPTGIYIYWQLQINFDSVGTGDDPVVKLRFLTGRERPDPLVVFKLRLPVNGTAEHRRLFAKAGVV